MSRKKTKQSNLGRSLIKDRFRPVGGKRKENSYLHSAEVNDGYDWGRLNLQSVTEESSFQEFLSTAELAGTEFHAEKLNIKFVNVNADAGLLSKEEEIKILESHREKKSLLKIPRRPKWNKLMSAQDLEVSERNEFLEWRRQLMLIQENEDLIVTPYEKNLEFWKQLWRVIERSDVVVQIVDARNPLLFRCEDVEKYVKEMNSEKKNLILINKADYLSKEQREIWARYFIEQGVKVVFFSAMYSIEKSISDNKVHLNVEEDESDNEAQSNPEEDESYNESDYSCNLNSAIEKIENIQIKIEETKESKSTKDINLKNKSETVQDGVNLKNVEEGILQNASVDDDACILNNFSNILSRDELIAFFKSVFNGTTHINGVTTIGLIGYPNVGKSSTINALLRDKKVSVSTTPGKTKHFQTLFLEKDLLLCDCPGLVMPSFVCTKADMVLNGILPIDQLRDYTPPIALIGRLIPRYIIENIYGIMIPPPREGEDSDRPPTASEILDAYGSNRGFMTQNGQPDNPRSARYILKDFVNGKLLYCVAPPNYNQDKFHKFPKKSDLKLTRTWKPIKPIVDIDKTLQSHYSGVHDKGSQSKVQYKKKNGIKSFSENINHLGDLTKKRVKPVQHKKREKLRRVYVHLDQH